MLPVGASALAAAALVALIVPIANTITLWPAIQALRQPGEGPGVRALYSHLPSRSALVAENYWLARLINYMHFSGEVTPDPNPRVLDSDEHDVGAALSDGLQVYAFEGATHVRADADRAGSVRTMAAAAAAGHVDRDCRVRPRFADRVAAAGRPGSKRQTVQLRGGPLGDRRARRDRRAARQPGGHRAHRRRRGPRLDGVVER
jgi:hypothetical protein